MTEHFAPKRKDGRPLWRVVYDEVVSRIDAGSIELGDVIPDDEFTSLMTADERPRFWTAALRAARELEAERQRTLIRVRGKGYAFSGGMEQAEKASNHKRRGLRQMKRSRALVSTVDYSLVAPQSRPLIDRQIMAAGIIISILQRHENKLLEIGQEMQRLHSQQVHSSSRWQATEDDVAELKKRLAELEEKKRQ